MMTDTIEVTAQLSKPLTAVEYLASQGMHVAASDIPGLIWVDGRELTLGQVISLADQVSSHT